MRLFRHSRKTAKPGPEDRMCRRRLGAGDGNQSGPWQPVDIELDSQRGYAEAELWAPMNATFRLVQPWYTSKNGKKVVAELYKTSAELLLATLSDNSIDLIITSPPYCMGMEYEKSTSAEDFLHDHKKIFPEIARVLRPGGSVCWQVGHHVSNGVVTPLDALVYIAAQKSPELVLRNRIVWTFGHGLRSPNRFSGRHETVLWFTKGDDYIFNLDDVRVPQKYPGKRHYKGEKKGRLSGNPNCYTGPKPLLCEKSVEIGSRGEIVFNWPHSRIDGIVQ